MTTARRGVWRLLAWSAAGIVLLLSIPVLLVVVGVTLDAGPWRGQVAQAIGRALHREVRFDGPARITFSLQPELQVGGIRILNPPGFPEPDLATFGEGQFKLDLLPLLQRRLRIRDFSARDVHLRLQVLADGRVNWLPVADPDAATEVVAAPRPASGATPLLRSADLAGASIEQARLERIAVEFVGADGKPRYFNLDNLEAKAAQGQPLEVVMSGRVEGNFPYTVGFSGGSLAALAAMREPWPLKLKLGFAGTELGLDGNLFRPLTGGHVELAFSLRSDDLSQLERLLQTQLPPVGAVSLATRVRWQAGQLDLADIDGQMGQTSLRGHLGLSTAGPVPKLTGALTVPVLDLRPFRGQPSATDEAPKSLLDTYRDLQMQTFDLRRLADLDAELRLEVGQWLSLPGDVHDASMVIQLERGVLRSPLQVVAAGVPLQGRVEIDGSAATPTFSLALSTQSTRLGGLARLLARIEGVEGEMERFDFGLAARGGTLGALTQSLAVTVALDRARLSYGNVAGGRPVELRLDRFQVELPAGAALRGRARGALLGEAFSADFRGGDLPSLARGARWPVGLRVQASGAQVEVSGHMAEAAAGLGADLRFDLEAAHAGSVARWLGLAPDAQAPVRMGGRLSARRDAIWLRDLALALGRTRLNGELGRTGLTGTRPLATARLDIAEIDVPQLQTLLPPARPKPPGSAGTNLAATLELPILPQGIDLSDADFQLQLHRLQLPKTEVTDLRFEGQVREGHMSSAPFSATIAGTPFNGSAAVDLRGAVPEVTLQLAAAKVDIGGLLRRLQVAEDLDARVDALQLAVVLRGSRLGEIVERSELKAELLGGQWTLRNPANQPLAAIAVVKGTVEAPVGAPVRLAIDGTIDDTPVAILVSSGALVDLARVGSRVPFTLSAEAAGARLDLDGSVRVPLTQRVGDLRLRLAGNRLDSLNRLARTELPPWGPWSLAGRFNASERAYEMPSLELRVGASRLDGQGSINFTGERPRVKLELQTPSIQLDDFRFGDWSPVTKAAPPPAIPKDERQVREQARSAAQQGQRLLSRATLLKQDVDLDVDVVQVQSGADHLGSGKLRARLNAGRFELAPAEVRVPSGAARIEMSYEPLPGDREVALRSRVRVDRFDYAVLARRVKPDADLKGRFSLHFDLDATSPLEDLMQHGNGKLDIAVWPIDLKAGVFDLWAVNVFVALLPALDGSAASRVNCAVARFDLREGRLKEDMLLVDTTRLRAGGTARVDFHDESLAVLLQPKAKEPQFFSLATPVEVTGHITKYTVGTPKGSILGTIGRFFGSIVTTPFEMLTATPPPADGADVCDRAMRAAE